MCFQAGVRLVVILLILSVGCVFAADGPQITEVEMNKPLNLRQWDGPNVDLIVNEVDISDVVITLVDYDRTKLGGWGNESAGYHVSSEPTRTQTRIKKQNGAVLFRSGRLKVLYIDAMDTSIGHVKLGIISE